MAFATSVTPIADPADALFVAMAATVAGILALLAFILIRRIIRRRYFARCDRRAQHIREHWDRIVAGDVPAGQWYFDATDHAIVERIALDRMDVAGPNEIRQLQEFVRRSGLLDKRIREVRTFRGWPRRQSLVALSRMRTPESIPALAEALERAEGEMAVDAIHALGQVGIPRAAEPILRRTSNGGLHCPPQVLQGALLSCYRIHAPALLSRVHEADDATRPVLARVLAEVAHPKMKGDLLTLAADPLAEVRAAAARVLPVMRPHYALQTLARLAADKEWFVRLRAVVALGDLGERRSIPALIHGLCDENRLVRLRAAASLVRFEGEEERVLQLAMRTRDRYALQALVSEMERSGRIPDLVAALADDGRRALAEPALFAALQGGSMTLLIDLMLHHADRRVRNRLARLLAASGDTALLAHLEQVEMSLASHDQQRVLRWVIGKLREPGAAGEARMAVAV
jgi:hypothetical protein